jgi:hypothetical protein
MMMMMMTMVMVMKQQLAGELGFFFSPHGSNFYSLVSTWMFRGDLLWSGS